MTRILLGLVVILHALAHASLAVWAAPYAPRWLIDVLWSLALLGYLAAGLGILRLPVMRHFWKQMMVIATVSSIVILLLTRHLMGAAGVAMDVALLVFVLGWAQLRIDADVAVSDAVGAAGLGHAWLRRVAWGVGGTALVYAAVVVAVRPLYVRWGTTAVERSAPLPGDELVRDARYRVDHGITIKAPADSVWPWLVQLGQDRGGFYSYDWLERMAGTQIRNADRLHPEWQAIKAGDLVRATPPGYLGGRFGELGWRVAQIVPGRAIVLENWGAFVVQPVDSATSRFFVRTRGAGTPSLLGVALGPVNILLFEPVHFIMERGMMRGIRDRAERAVQRSAMALARSPLNQAAIIR